MVEPKHVPHLNDAAMDIYVALEDLLIHLSMGWELDDVITNAIAALNKARGDAQ